MRSLTRPHQGGFTNGARLVSCVAGVLLIGAGVLHVSAAADHENLPLMMAGFLVIATLQVGLGGLLLARRPGVLLIAAGSLMLCSAIGIWLLSRTAGLPFLPGGHMEPIGFKDGVCVLFEIGALPALLLLASRDLASVTLPSPRLGSQTLGMLGAGMFALFVPALMLDGGGHHSEEQMAAMAGHGHGEGGHGHGEQRASGQSAHAEGGHPHAGGERGQTAGTHASGGGSGHGHTDPSRQVAAMLPGHDQHQAAAGGGHTGSGHTGAGHQGGSGHEHGKRDAAKPRGHSHGKREQGGHAHGGDKPAAGGHDHPKAGAAGDGHDDHGSEEPPPPSGTWEAGRPASGGKPAKGSALVFRGDRNEQLNGPGHAHAGECNPTAAQRAAADELYRRTKAVLQKYKNNPFQAYLDGFTWQFGPTDRMIHMVSPKRVGTPTILDPNEIESFIYVMTDTGYEPVGGMYILPDDGMRGPQPGGCITQWHHHGGLVGLAASGGTMTTTPEMLHVWTYPGLEPYAHYDGREMSQLWGPGSYAPSVCRESGDAMDGCLP